MSIFGSKVYELPLTPEYVSGWTVIDAARELLQNAIDSPAPFDVVQTGDRLVITSKGVRLDTATLVLGRTTKSESVGSIGQFGEGYKLALLVLLRCGRSVRVLNGGVNWVPEFRRSAQFGIETLHIVESKSTLGESIDGVQFIVSGLSGEEQDAIKQSCLLMQPHYPDTISTSYGDILPNLPGKLFVGGLFVCNTELDYGYNLNPGEVELERDRKTIDGFDLRFKTKDVWLSTQKFDQIAELLDKNCKDVDLVQYSCPEMLKEACYKHFVKNHPGHVIAKDQEQLEDLVKRGMTVYIAGGAYYQAVSTSKSYQASGAAIPRPRPVEILSDWYNDNKKYMSRLPSASFKKILQRAQDWVDQSK